MGKAILMSGGAGGITSDDVTASKAQVLQGYETVTTDSNDEVVEGAIKSIDTGMDNNNFNKQNKSYGIDGGRGTFYIDLPHGDGYYYRADGHPHTCVDAEKLGNATADHVLNGSTFTSKNGVAVRGTMPNRGTWVAPTEVVTATWENSLHVRFEPGYYAEGGGYKPTAKVPYAVLANVLGIDTGKMLSSLTIAGRRGQVKMIKTSDDNYKINKQTASYGIDGVRGTFYIDMPHGNAYYYRDDGHPHTCIDAEKLGDTTAGKVLQGSTFTSKNGVKVPGTMHNHGSYVDAIGVWYHGGGGNLVGQIPEGYYGKDNGAGRTNVNLKKNDIFAALGLNPDLWLDSFQTMGVQGKVPRWVCTTGDIISAYHGEGFAWDDSYAGRGRGIIVKIPQGHYIQGANWVFLPSPNLQPQNIRAGVNINGVTGTMVDYGAGRVPFRNATFDNRLISGVANKGFILRGIPRFLNLKDSSNGYWGIQDGGMKFVNFYEGNTRQVSAPDVGCVFAHSINLSPFRYIKVGFKVFRFVGDGTAAQPARVNFEIGVTPVSNAGGESYNAASNTVLKDVGNVSNSTSHVMISTKPNAGDQSNHSQLYLTLDVSANQGHHFLYLMLGNIVHEYGKGAVSSNVVVNYIEFIN